MLVCVRLTQFILSLIIENIWFDYKWKREEILPLKNKLSWRGVFTVGITNRIHFHSSINESSLIIHLYIDQTIFGIMFTKSCQKLSLFVDENYLIHSTLTFQEKSI